MMELRDKYGWPVEIIKGKPITNIIRRIIWTNIRQTWKRKNMKETIPTMEVYVRGIPTTAYIVSKGENKNKADRLTFTKYTTNGK